MTEVEVGREPLDETVLGGGLVLDESHEIMEDGEWIRAVRRWTGNDDLFIYRHKEIGSFVLAEWRQRQPAIIQEIEVLGMVPPDWGSWLPKKVIEYRCRPAWMMQREIADRIRTNKRTRRDLRLDSREERKDTAKWLRGKGKAAEAALFEKSMAPGTLEGGESLAALKEDLNRMASGRIITHG